MSENRYTYGTWHNLRPVDVFALVAFDETRKQLGLDDLAAASAMLLGQVMSLSLARWPELRRALPSPRLPPASCFPRRCRFACR
nr:hypothetical protein [Burkholderia anthina]